MITKPTKYNTKKGDVVYSMVEAQLNAAIPPVYKVYKIVELDRNGEKDIVITLVGIDGSIRKEPPDYFKKAYEPYDRMCKHYVDLDKDGFPYPRELELVIRNNRIKYPEYYI